MKRTGITSNHVKRSLRKAIQVLETAMEHPDQGTPGARRDLRRIRRRRARLEISGAMPGLRQSLLSSLRQSELSPCITSLSGECPVVATLVLMSTVARVPLDRMLGGMLCESQFLRLIRSARRIAGSMLQFRS